MKKFTLRKGFLGSKCGTRSSFKGFVMLQYSVNSYVID